MSPKAGRPDVEVPRNGCPTATSESSDVRPGRRCRSLEEIRRGEDLAHRHALVGIAERQLAGVRRRHGKRGSSGRTSASRFSPAKNAVPSGISVAVPWRPRERSSGPVASPRSRVPRSTSLGSNIWKK